MLKSLLGPGGIEGCESCCHVEAHGVTGLLLDVGDLLRERGRRPHVAEDGRSVECSELPYVVRSLSSLECPSGGELGDSDVKGVLLRLPLLIRTLPVSSRGVLGSGPACMWSCNGHPHHSHTQVEGLATVTSVFSEYGHQ